MAEFGDDGLAVLGEHEGDGERRASAELAPGSVRFGSDVGMVDRTRYVSNESGRDWRVWVSRG